MQQWYTCTRSAHPLMYTTWSTIFCTSSAEAIVTAGSSRSCNQCSEGAVIEHKQLAALDCPCWHTTALLRAHCQHTVTHHSSHRALQRCKE
eukprot:9120-Heterococcus_DN1.PRE.1